jgi:hypothetical protein
MEKIYFDDTTYIWKTKLNLFNDKSLFLKEAYSVIDSQSNLEGDAFPYPNKWNKNLDFIGEFKIETKLDEICKIGINECKKLFETKNIAYNKVNSGNWINVVKSKNPVQPQFKNGKLNDNIDVYHTHTKIAEQRGKFFPYYTYVYYIQMPDIMEGKDGVLYFKSKEDKEYWIRPEEDDLIIMEADMPHAPNNAPGSTLDRIVMAGNVGFDFIKNQKSII